MALAPLLDVSDADTQHTILVVAADRPARAALGDDLTADGHEVLEAGAVTSARLLLNQRAVDLAIIHRELPDGDGLELLRHIRSADQPAARLDCEMPVVLIAHSAAPIDRIRAFERGCDDYLVLGEVSYPELRARIGALLRRRRSRPPSSRIRVGTLEIDVLARQVWVSGCPVPLARREFSLLVTLAREPGRVFRREELMAAVWGWSDGAIANRTRTLDSHASRLRRKLSAHGDSYVVNVWGVGYRLIDLSAIGPATAEVRQLVA